jgi:hypothetical protein
MTFLGVQNEFLVRQKDRALDKCSSKCKNSHNAQWICMKVHCALWEFLLYDDDVIWKKVQEPAGKKIKTPKFQFFPK